jgi:hypothetical protein
VDDLDLGNAFLDAVDTVGSAFLDALDSSTVQTATAPAPAAAGGDDGFDLEASLKEEAALAAWIARATARRKQVTAVNRRALIAIEKKTSGRTWTPSVDGVQVGTVTLKGNAHDVVVDDEDAFAGWVHDTFPTEITATLDLGDVRDPAALAQWLVDHGAPCTPSVRYEVRGSFRTSVLADLSKGATTKLTKVVDKTTGEAVQYDVRGVTVRAVPPEARVHQITFNKHGGADAAAAYLESRGLAALIPGEGEGP